MLAERKKILEMLAAGKITAEEAEKLLDKIEGAGRAAVQSAGHDNESGEKKPRFLRIEVEKPGQDQVNIRVPLAFARAGRASWRFCRRGSTSAWRNLVWTFPPSRPCRNAIGTKPWRKPTLMFPTETARKSVSSASNGCAGLPARAAVLGYNEGFGGRPGSPPSARVSNWQPNWS